MKWKWGPLEYQKIWGSDEVGAWTPYRTMLAIGRLRLHIFHRGDRDPDPHDHMWDFWTFPLTSYVEQVFDEPSTIVEGRRNVVKSFRLHHRSAEYQHILVGRRGPLDFVNYSGRVVTIVWVSEKRRDWGFWPLSTDKKSRVFTPWTKYIYGDSHD